MQQLNAGSLTSSGATQLPDLFDVEGWMEPATPKEVELLIQFLGALLEPDITDTKALYLRDLIVDRPFSRPMLYWIGRELPFDTRASHNYNRGLNPADFERLAEDVNGLRRMLTTRLREDELIGLLRHKMCGHLSKEDFGVVAQDQRGNLYLYRRHRELPESSLRRLEAPTQAQLPERTSLADAVFTGTPTVHSLDREEVLVRRG